MTRIALLPSAYLPHLGGVEELTRHLALHLLDAGDEVEVWTQVDDERALPTVEVLDGVTVRRFPFPLPRTNPRAALAAAVGAMSTMRSLRSAVRSFRPDLLHVQCFGPNGAYATALSYLSGIPLVVSLQGETVMDDQNAFDISTTLRAALRLGLRRAHTVTGCSRFTLDDAERRFGLTPGRGEVIFNGVSLDDAATAATSQRPPALTGVRGRYVFALGRLVDKKGFDLLARAFATIADQHPDVDLVIAGSGPSEPMLQDLISREGMAGRTHLVGRLSRTDVAGAMTHADLFVMPSRLEPFGIVVLEAWRAGTAVVATSTGGPPEYVTEAGNGLLVEPTDIGTFAAVLDRALCCDQLRRDLGSAGQQSVQSFAWPVIAERYRSSYACAAGVRSVHEGLVRG